MKAQPRTLDALDRAILHAIATLEPNANGAAIRAFISERLPRMPAFGTVVFVLDQFEQWRYVTTHEVYGTSMDGWRLRRHFKIAPAGRAALDEATR